MTDLQREINESGEIDKAVEKQKPVNGTVVQIQLMNMVQMWYKIIYIMKA